MRRPSLWKQRSGGSTGFGRNESSLDPRRVRDAAELPLITLTATSARLRESILPAPPRSASLRRCGCPFSILGFTLARPSEVLRRDEAVVNLAADMKSKLQGPAPEAFIEVLAHSYVL